MKAHKKHFFHILTSIMLSTELFAGDVITEGEDLIINTQSGLELHTSDKQFSFELGGKIQWDATLFDGLQAASQNAPFEETLNTFIRRGELSIDGIAYKDWGYGLRLAYDDGDGEDNTTEIDRSFINYTGFDFADITIGKFGVDYGLENTTSSSWITAMERPYMYDFLNGAEDPKFGIKLTHTGKNYGLMAQLGHSDNYESSEDGNHENFAYTLRANWAPYVKENNLIHLGINYHDAKPDNSRARARSRLGIRSDNDDRLSFADIDNTQSDTEWVLETAAQFEGLRFQAEYFQRNFSGEDDSGQYSRANLNGYYGQLSYMLNGAREYKKSNGKWGKPTQTGAVELFTRYESSTIDADENAIPDELNNNVDGIFVNDPTSHFKTDAWVVGVNYFPVPAVRISLNYVDYNVDNIDTSASIDSESVTNNGKAIMGRLQYSF